MNGPGMFVYQASKCRGGSARRFVAMAVSQGWRWIAPKLVNESGKQRMEDMLFIEQARLGLEAAGIAIVPWCYLHPGNAGAMAQLCADVCARFGARAFIVNAEKEFKVTGEGAGPAQIRAEAERFCTMFRQLAPGVKLILSTFAQESLHGAFCYEAFLRHCDGFVPQCYGSYPSKQLAEAQRTAEKYKVDLIPTFRAYRGDGIEDREKILREAVQMGAAARLGGCKAWNWWHWQAVEAWPEMLAALKHDLLVGQDTPYEKTQPEGCATNEKMKEQVRTVIARLRDDEGIMHRHAESIGAAAAALEEIVGKLA